MAAEEEAKPKAETTKASKAPSDKESEATPSGSASKEAGELDEDASDEDKVAWNEKYLEAKLKARRG